MPPLASSSCTSFSTRTSLRIAAPGLILASDTNSSSSLGSLPMTYMRSTNTGESLARALTAIGICSSLKTDLAVLRIRLSASSP